MNGPVMKGPVSGANARGVTIVGGGIASLLLGLELRRTRPDIPVVVLSADTPERAGGHLASWDDQGYPVEHGFHALFDFYEAALGLLGRHGLAERFVPGPPDFFVYDDDRITSVPHGLRGSTAAPARLVDRIRGLRMLPAVAATLHAIERGDARTLTTLDSEDFRETLLRLGAGPTFVESPTVRMFYDFGFVGDDRLSSAVAFAILGRLLRTKRLLHFPGPSRDTLIDPLRALLLSSGATMIDRLTLTEIQLEGGRAKALVLRGPDGERVERPVDELVLGLPIESFKHLEWTGAPAPAFVRDASRLRGVESLSLQAWFDEDPVPPGIDSVIGGLPEPWSTVCPQTRVRKRGRGPHGYELIACGPATGFANVSDDDLAARFFATLTRLGFTIPKDGHRSRGVHVVVRRNRSTAERYLLTRPGELWLRPPPVTSMANVSLVGAWLRVPFTLPSVEAVAQSVLVVRDALERRLAPSPVVVADSRPFAAASAGDSWALCPPPPYRHEGITRLFSVRVAADALRARIPDALVLAPGFADRVLWFATRYDEAYSIVDPAAARHTAQELMLAAVVRERGAPSRPPGLFPFILYIDSDVAMTVGREVYGFAKRFATIMLDRQSMIVTRRLRPLGQASPHTSPLPLLRMGWRRSVSSDGRIMKAGAKGLASLVDAKGGLSIYNATTPVCPPGLSGPLVRRALIRVQATDVSLGPATLLTGMRAELVANHTDPLHELLPPGAETFAARTGLEFSLGFSIAACQEIPDAR